MLSPGYLQILLVPWIILLILTNINKLSAEEEVVQLGAELKHNTYTPVTKIHEDNPAAKASTTPTIKRTTPPTLVQPSNENDNQTVAIKIGKKNRKFALRGSEEYIDRLITSLESRVRRNGLDSLPVGDAIMELNRTVYQQHLLGKTYYTAGFVVNSSQWSRYTRFFQQNVKDETAYILAKMDISNLTLFYNFFANLSIAKISGTAIHRFPTNVIAMHLEFNATSGKAEVKSMSPFDVRGPLTDYSPKTNVSSAIARMARLRASGILWKDLEVWMNQTFIPMANSIIEEVPMPLHELN